MQPLVLTPSPYPTESLLGYTLRLSEKNGYETPTYVLDYAGITRREALSPFFPVDRIAAVLGKQPEDLLPIAYSARNDAGALRFRILKHDLGQSFKHRTYRLSKPAFCPRCVSEKGYLEAHWDLELVTACPHHGCRLLTACPECGKKVIWHRQGLLKCECGHDWSGVKTAPADSAVVELQAILVSKIRGVSVDGRLSAGMPIEHLQRLSLSALLGAIEIVGRSAAKCGKSEDMDRYEMVAKAADVFASWPVNFERLIDAITADFGGTGLKHFLSALARAGVTAESGRFLRDPVRNRMAELPPLNPRAGRRVKRAKRAVDDTCKIKLSGPIRHNSIGERRAAAFLEIPVKALSSLRASGHYRVLNIPIPTSAYHVKDLEDFQSKILDCAPTCPVGEGANEGDVLSLGYILQEFRFRSNTGKGDLLAAIMDGEMTVIGRAGDRIPDIVLRKSDVIAFRDKTRIRAEGGTLSPAETAKYLYCDPTILPALIKDGSLQAIRVPGGIRLTESSVTQFGATFVSVAKLAKKFGSSSRRLQHEMRKWNIPWSEFERGYGKPVQAFVSAQDEARLDEICQLMKAASQMPVRPSAMSALKQFLTNLKETGVPLPRRNGKPNKRAIAKACGFDRNMLYTNEEAARLLNMYHTKDIKRHGPTIQE